MRRHVYDVYNTTSPERQCNVGPTFSPVVGILFSCDVAVVVVAAVELLPKPLRKRTFFLCENCFTVH